MPAASLFSITTTGRIGGNLYFNYWVTVDLPRTESARTLAKWITKRQNHWDTQMVACRSGHPNI